MESKDFLTIFTEPDLNSFNAKYSKGKELPYILCLIQGKTKDTPENRELYKQNKIFTLLGLQ